MATVTNTFNRYVANATSASVSLVSGNVPTSTDMTCLGLTVANTHTASITIDVEFYDGSNYFYLLKDTPVPLGESMIVIGWDQKLVLKTGDNIRVTTGVGETADVVMSVLEILTT